MQQGNGQELGLPTSLHCWIKASALGELRLHITPENKQKGLIPSSNPPEPHSNLTTACSKPPPCNGGQFIVTYPKPPEPCSVLGFSFSA